MFISVVICTRNRADSLRETLDSLFCPGNLQEPDWEALVVETSTDATPEVCRDFQKRFPGHFRFITEKKLGKSHALNTAIMSVKGDVLAFTDDDVHCAPDFIRAIREVFSTNDADAAQGRVLLDCEGGWPKWLDKDSHLALMADLRDFGDEITEFKGTLCGTNMIVRAHVFRKSGSYAPELGPSPNGVGMWEDTEASLRMTKAGARMIYAPQIVVRHQWHEGRLTKEFIRSRFFGQGRAQAYYDDLPASSFRFGLYVMKEMIHYETEALWYFCTGRPGKALRSQCEWRSYAGLWYQHRLFRRGLPRRLSTDLLSFPEESGSGKLDREQLLLQ